MQAPEVAWTLDKIDEMARALPISYERVPLEGPAAPAVKPEVKGLTRLIPGGKAEKILLERRKKAVATDVEPAAGLQGRSRRKRSRKEPAVVESEISPPAKRSRKVPAAREPVPPKPAPKPSSKPASKAPSKKAAAAETYKTDYVKQHPEEDFYHGGKGNWHRGLPPPGADPRTGVRGPGAEKWKEENTVTGKKKVKAEAAESG